LVQSCDERPRAAARPLYLRADSFDPLCVKLSGIDRQALA